MDDGGPLIAWWQMRLVAYAVALAVFLWRRPAGTLRATLLATLAAFLAFALTMLGALLLQGLGSGVLPLILLAGVLAEMVPIPVFLLLLGVVLNRRAGSGAARTPSS